MTAVTSVTGTTSVSSATSTQYLVQGGGALIVESGGSITGAVVSSGGDLFLSSGAVETSATILAGGVMSAAKGGVLSASNDLIYGTLSTTSAGAGAFTSETVENGGKFYLQNGNTANDTVVESGGQFVITGADQAANNTTLVGGGVLSLSSPKATISGSLTFSGGDNDLVILSAASSGAGDLAVISGFSSTDKVNVSVFAGATPVYSSPAAGEEALSFTSGSTTEVITFSGANYTSDTLLVESGYIVYVPPTVSTVNANASGLTVVSGEILNVVSGATVASTTVLGGGTLVVDDSMDIGGTVDFAGAESVVGAGSASQDIIYGSLTVFSGSISSATVENGGVLTVTGAGALDTATTVSSGGSENVFSSAVASGDSVYGSMTVSGAMLSNVTVGGGGVVEVAGGGIVQGATLDGGATIGLQTSGATLSGVVSFANGNNVVSVGKVLSAGALSGAIFEGFSPSDEINVSALVGSGATISFNAPAAGEESISFALSGTTDTFTFSGAGYNGYTLAVSGGDITYNPNASPPSTLSSGTTSFYVVSSGQTLTVESGATVDSTTVLAGGTLDIGGGVDLGATVASGGVENVTTGGSASGDLIYGSLTVSGGSLTSATVENGGALTVGSGGVGSANEVSSGGSERVLAGGSATSDVVYGSLTVSAADIANETVESGGSASLGSGAVDSGMIVSAGGYVLVDAASGSATLTGDSIYGVISTVSKNAATFTNETVYSGGLLFLANSNNATGTIVMSGGQLVMSGSETAANTTLVGGGLLELQSPKATLSGSLTFSGGGNTLEFAADSDAGYGDQAVISGFSATDMIDIPSAAFSGAALTLSQSTSNGETLAQVLSGGGVVETLAFSGTALDGDLSLVSDNHGGLILEVSPAPTTATVSTTTSSGAYNLTLNQTLRVESGGSVTGVTVGDGAFLTVDGGVDAGALVLSGGSETVSAGSASGDQIAGSAVVSGGSVSGETITSGGAMTLDGGASSNLTLDGGATLDVGSSATLTSDVSFANGRNTLVVAAGDVGDGAVISGYSTSDRIELAGISSSGAMLSFTSGAGGEEIATVSNGGESQSLTFADSSTYSAATMSLAPDGANVDLVLDTTPAVAFTTLNDLATNRASYLVNGTVDVAADPYAIGTTVSVLEGGAVVGQATVQSDGFWQADVALANVDGANALVATDTDLAGNMGSTGQSLTLTADTSAPAFTPGNLVISISGDGDGSGAYGDNQASPITLEQITTTGAIVSQLVLPQTTTTINGVTEYAISGEYGSSSEGALQLSADGRSLTIAGYGVDDAMYNAGGAAVYGDDALAQSTSITGGAYTAVPRVPADIGVDGIVDDSTQLYNVYNTNNPRSVVTVNGSSFFVSGQGDKNATSLDQGVFYATEGSSTASPLNTVSDTRDVEIYDDNVYVSIDSKQDTALSGSGIYLLGSVPGLEGAASQVTPTILPGMTGATVLTSATENGVNDADVGQSVNLSPESFFFANPDTLYVADGGAPKEGGVGDGGLQKWVYSGSQWTLEYTLSAGLNLINNDSGAAATGDTGVIGLTGEVQSGNVLLYATTEPLNDLGATSVVTVTDSLAATSGAGESFTTVLNASPGENIRGVSFAPTGVAPTISGTVANQATTSEALVQPFSGVTVSDANSNATDALTITVTGAGGLLSGAGLSGGSGGVYTLSADTASSITAALDALMFTPTAGGPNTSSTTTFTLSDTSSAYATPTTDSTTSVVDTDPSVAPTIAGTAANQTTTSEAPVQPFSGVTVGDANSNATDTLTITLGGAGGTLSGTGLSGGSGGVYTLTGTAQTITSELDALTFTPTAGGASSTTTFTLSDQSTAYSTPTVDATTSVVDSGAYQDIAQSGVSIDVSNTAVSFSASANNDVVVGDNDTVTVPSGETVGFIGAGDSVQQSNGVAYLGDGSNVSIGGNGDIANTSASGDVIGFTGTGDIAEISNGTVYLGAGSNVVTEGDNDVVNTSASGDVMGFVGTGDTAEISNGTVYLGAGSNVVTEGNNDVVNTSASGDVMGFVGTGDTAEISDGTIYLGAGSSVAIEGGGDVANTAASGDTMTFAGAGETAEISNGTVGLYNASVALVGGADTISLAALFGMDTLNGFSGSDVLQFSHQDFASAAAVLSAATQSGSDTLIALDANDTLRLTGVSAASLTAAEIKIV